MDGSLSKPERWQMGCDFWTHCDACSAGSDSVPGDPMKFGFQEKICGESLAVPAIDVEEEE